LARADTVEQLGVTRIDRSLLAVKHLARQSVKLLAFIESEPDSLSQLPAPKILQKELGLEQAPQFPASAVELIGRALRSEPLQDGRSCGGVSGVGA
jgi:hypothetical protein